MGRPNLSQFQRVCSSVLDKSFCTSERFFGWYRRFLLACGPASTGYVLTLLPAQRLCKGGIF